MNHARWAMWRAATGHVKGSIFSELMAENEPLVEKFASDFLKHTRCYTGHIDDDIFQAARIGVMQAIRQWDPARGAFSTIAFHCARYEMQGVLKHGARPISVDRRANLPRAKQDAAAVFYARHGREATLEELGISPGNARLDEKANATYVPLSEADEVPVDPEDAPEDRIDRARDVRALQTWLGRLSAEEVEEFWSGTRPDLELAARAYVEQNQ